MQGSDWKNRRTAPGATLCALALTTAIYSGFVATEAVADEGVDDADVQSTTATGGEERENGRREVIVVTGTNIAGTENPSTPVFMFDREDIELSGVGTVQEFLGTIPQVFSGSAAALVASSGSPNDDSGNTSRATVPDLRGLGEGATLTLVNGRRLSLTHAGRYFDTSLIPLSIVERVDVLTDGASAIYGSDAIGGVVNFITRSNFEGVEASARVANVTEGSMLQRQASVTGGLDWETGGGFLSVSYRDDDPLLAADRDYTTYGDVAGDAMLYPKEHQAGVFGSLNQDVTSRLSFGVDALYSSRSVNTVSFSSYRFTNDVDEESYFINSRLRYQLSDAWGAEAFFDYGDDQSSSVQETPTRRTPGERANSLANFEGRLNGELFELPGGAISTAFGGFFRAEHFETPNDDPQRNVDVTRDIYGAYGEVFVPLIGKANEVPLAERLELSLAVRYEDYEDFGDTTNPKYGVYWELVDGFALRGTYSESFRAPSQSQLYGGRQLIVAPSVDPNLDPADQDPRLPDGAAYAMYFASYNPTLQPETAESWTAGGVFEPPSAPGLRLEATYFNTSYKNRIENLSSSVVLVQPEYAAYVDRDPDLAFLQDILDHTDEYRYANWMPFFSDDPSLLDVTADQIQVFFNAGFQNVAVREVQGVDLGAQYAFRARAGDFNATLNATYLFDYKIAASEAASLDDFVDRVYRPVDLKLRGTLAWSRDGVTAFAALNYVDNYTDDLFHGEPVEIDSWTTADLALTFDTSDRIDGGWASNTRLSLSVQNVFDEDPPFVETSDGFFFDAANANPLGRLVAVQVTKGF